eukprot:10254592-Alexandrium_andersonii.AAC.1
MTTSPSSTELSASTASTSMGSAAVGGRAAAWRLRRMGAPGAAGAAACLWPKACLLYTSDAADDM